MTHFYGQCSVDKLEKFGTFWSALPKARRMSFLRQLDALTDVFIAEGDERMNHPHGNGFDWKENSKKSSMGIKRKQSF